jgi:hypothetical protein
MNFTRAFDIFVHEFLSNPESNFEHFALEQLWNPDHFLTNNLLTVFQRRRLPEDYFHLTTA